MKSFKIISISSIFSVLAFLFALNFSSCENFSDSGPAAFAPPVVQPGAAAQKKTIIFQATVDIDGQKNPGSQLVSASANPDIHTDEYYYYVVATPKDNVGNVPIEYGKDDQDKFANGANGVSFAIGLLAGSWEIECGLKSAVTNKSVLRATSGLITLTETDSVVNKSFIAVPAQDAGDGRILLFINKGAVSACDTAVELDKRGRRRRDPCFG